MTRYGSTDARKSVDDEKHPNRLLAASEIHLCGQNADRAARWRAARAARTSRSSARSRDRRTSDEWGKPGRARGNLPSERGAGAERPSWTKGRRGARDPRPRARSSAGSNVVRRTRRSAQRRELPYKARGDATFRGWRTRRQGHRHRRLVLPAGRRHPRVHRADAAAARLGGPRSDDRLASPPASRRRRGERNCDRLRVHAGRVLRPRARLGPAEQRRLVRRRLHASDHGFCELGHGGGLRRSRRGQPERCDVRLRGIFAAWIFLR